jgi:hypothetical protein
LGSGCLSGTPELREGLRCTTHYILLDLHIDRLYGATTHQCADSQACCGAKTHASR